MRYGEIIDYENETLADRLARLAIMYGNDDADAKEQEAETDLCRAKAEKMRADALAAVAKAEAQYDDLVFEEAQRLIGATISTRPLVHPDLRCDGISPDRAT